MDTKTLRLTVLSKKDYFRRLMAAENEGAWLHFDATVAGVDVPENLRENKIVAFVFGYSLAMPTNDVEISDDTVTATLLFSGAQHKVIVPWRAVFAIVNHEGAGLLWSDDAPKETLEFYGLQEVGTVASPTENVKLTVLEGGIN